MIQPAPLRIRRSSVVVCLYPFFRKFLEIIRNPRIHPSTVVSNDHFRDTPPIFTIVDGSGKKLIRDVILTQKNTPSPKAFETGNMHQPSAGVIQA